MKEVVVYFHGNNDKGRPNGLTTVGHLSWPNSEGIQIDLRTLKINWQLQAH